MIGRGGETPDLGGKEGEEEISIEKVGKVAGDDKEETRQDKGDMEEVSASKSKDAGAAKEKLNEESAERKEDGGETKDKEEEEAKGGDGKTVATVETEDEVKENEEKGQDKAHGMETEMEVAAKGSMNDKGEQESARMESSMQEREGEEFPYLEICVTEHIGNEDITNEAVDAKMSFGWWLREREELGALARTLER